MRLKISRGVLIVLSVVLVVGLIAGGITRLLASRDKEVVAEPSLSSSPSSLPVPAQSLGASAAPWETPEVFDTGEGLPRVSVDSPAPKTNDWKVFGAGLATGLYNRDWSVTSREKLRQAVMSSCLSEDHGLKDKARVLCERSADVVAGSQEVFDARQASKTMTRLEITDMKVEDIPHVLTPYGDWFAPLIREADKGRGIGAFTIVGTLTETKDGVTTVSPFRLGVLCWYQVPQGEKWSSFDVVYGTGMPKDSWIELLGVFEGGF